MNTMSRTLNFVRNFQSYPCLNYDILSDINQQKALDQNEKRFPCNHMQISGSNQVGERLIHLLQLQGE
jgi:hypothetical protein